MGTAALIWDGNKFLFLMNRDKSDFLEEEISEIKRNARGKKAKHFQDRRGQSVVAEIDAKYAVIQGGNEMWGGSWYGYKNGRFAFVLDSSDSEYGATLVPRFLESTMSPKKFAFDLTEMEGASFGLNLHLVIADMDPYTQAIYHITKRSASEKEPRIDNVFYGVHTISDSGFDSSSPKDADLRENLTQMIEKDGACEFLWKNSPVYDIAEHLMKNSALFKDMIDVSGNVVVPYTKHLVGLQVSSVSGKGQLYEWTAPAISTIEYY